MNGVYLIEYCDNRSNINYRFFEYDDEGCNFFREYQNWMSKNSIRSNTSNIRFNAFYKEQNSDLREIVDKLTGLVKMDNYGLDFGEQFYEFYDMFYEDDDALKKLKKKLSII